ncbi:MAG TPA: hypothetical protein VNE00_10095 [Paraburkholderia sp.]|jgi:hypothetical protein|nr:hypothetical protein [Paraburkholderia sp.]
MKPPEKYLEWLLRLAHDVKSRQQRMTAIGHAWRRGCADRVEFDQLPVEQSAKIRLIEVGSLFGMLDEHERGELMWT